jgi:hypothetical protein
MSFTFPHCHRYEQAFLTGYHVVHIRSIRELVAPQAIAFRDGRTGLAATLTLIVHSFTFPHGKRVHLYF